jgi:hypothetical protein
MQIMIFCLFRLASKVICKKDMEFLKEADQGDDLQVTEIKNFLKF